MWIKTIEGTLLNAANAEEFKILDPYGKDTPYILRACHGGDNAVALVTGTKDVCQMAMEDIEHGILTGAILVDLLKRETNKNVPV